MNPEVGEATDPLLVAGPDGEIRNDHPYLGAVLLLRHGDRRRDWMKEQITERHPAVEGEAWDLDDAIARAQEFERLMTDAEARGEVPHGGYFRADVIIAASNQATRLPSDVFDGPLDTRWELDEDTGTYVRVRPPEATH